MNPLSNWRILILSVVLSIGLVCASMAIWGSPGNTQSSGEESESSQPDWDEIIGPVEEQSMNLLFCGIDETQMLTDVILLGRYDVSAQKLWILQIPRDTFIGTGYPTGKINTVYGHPGDGKDGITALRELLEDQLVLSIDYYATITLEGVRKVVDAMGGVSMDVPVRVEYLPGQVIEPGWQTLSGEQAEWLIRYRKGYAMGDLGRIDMQKLFLQAAVEQMKSQGRLAAFRIISKNYRYCDTNLPLATLYQLANDIYNKQQFQMEFFLLEGTGKQYGSYSVYEADREAAAELLNTWFRPSDQSVEADALGLRQVPIPVQPESSEPQEQPPQEESSSEAQWEDFPPFQEDTPSSSQQQSSQDPPMRRPQWDILIP